MTSYEFTLVLDGADVLTDDIAERLFGAGCDDCTPSSSQGVVRAVFTRESANIDQAVRSAIEQIESVGLKVRCIEQHGAFRAVYEEWLSGRTLPPIPRGGRGCGTHALGDRMRSVKLVWRVLDTDCQAMVRQYFAVTEQHGEVLVNLA